MQTSISLRTRFAITFASLILALAVLLSITIGRRSSEDIKREIGNSLSETACQMADKLDYYMWCRIEGLKFVSEIDTLRELHDLSNIQSMLNRLKKSFPSFLWIGFIDTKGIVLEATDSIRVGKDISKQAVYKEGLKGQYVGEVQQSVLVDNLLLKPMQEPKKSIDISTPVKDRNGKTIGVLAAHLSWEWARKIEESIRKPLHNRKQIELFIVSDRDNMVILGPKNMIGKILLLNSVKRAKTDYNSWELETWPDGRSYLTGYAFSKGYQNYKGLGWTVLVRQPKEVAFAPVKQLQNYILILGGVTSVLFAVIGWFTAGRVAAPLRQIAVAADNLSSGEKVEIPEYKGITEIEMLSSSLRDLISSLTQTETALGKMEILAHHDRLTGLPNRIALDIHMQKSMKRAQRSGKTLTFLYLDLDGFKPVNDTLGHHIGDLLLQEVAVRLKKNIRAGEMVARIGGDEFAMILNTSAEQAVENGQAVANRVISTLEKPFKIEGHDIIIGCSIGGAVWPLCGYEPIKVMRLADQALYAAKRKGKNRAVFYSSKNAELVEENE